MIAIPVKDVPLLREFMDPEGRLLARVASGRPEDQVLIGARDVLAVDGDGNYHHLDGETLVELQPKKSIED